MQWQVWNLTEEQKDAFRNNIHSCRITAYAKDGDGWVTTPTVTLYDSDIIADSLVIRRSISEGKYVQLGATVAAEAEFSLNGDYADLLFGADMVIEIGVRGIADSYIPMGRFIADTSEYKDGVTDIVSYDHMVILNKKCGTDLRGMNINGIMAACTTETGVTIYPINFTTYPNGAFSLLTNVDAPDLDTTAFTWRDIVSACAAIIGCYATVDRDGTLTFAWLSANTKYDIPDAHRFAYKYNGTSVAIHGIKENETISGYGTDAPGGIVYDITGNILLAYGSNGDHYERSVATVIWERWTDSYYGLRTAYNAIMAETLSMPYMSLGEGYRIVDTTKVSTRYISSAITDLEYRLSGSFAINSRGETEKHAVNYGSGDAISVGTINASGGINASGIINAKNSMSWEVTGGWLCRYWADGHRECWNTVTGTIACNNAWGGLYVSGSSNLISASFPDGFFASGSVPEVHASLRPVGGGAFLIASGNGARTSDTSTGAYELARGTSSTSVYYEVCFYAIGTG